MTTTIAKTALALCLIGAVAQIAQARVVGPCSLCHVPQAHWRDDSDPGTAHLSGATRPRIESQKRLRTDRVLLGGD